jgi:tetratricopeptide (TPR) repeat protein
MGMVGGRKRIVVSGFLVASLVLGAGVGGCKPRDQARGGGAEDPVATAQAPSPTVRSGNSLSERDEAALAAGLQAYAQNRDDEAFSHLSPLTVNRNREIRGKAEAALGLIAQRRNEHARAADLLSSASTDLDGDDAARASLQAGHSLTALGRHIEASHQYRRAASLAESTSVRALVRPFTEPGPFAVQLGVFGSRSNADRTAAQASSRAASSGFGRVRVVPTRDSQGRSAFAVRVGTFPSRQSAVEARSKMGTGGVIVAAAN